MNGGIAAASSLIRNLPNGANPYFSSYALLPNAFGQREALYAKIYHFVGILKFINRPGRERIHLRKTMRPRVVPFI